MRQQADVGRLFSRRALLVGGAQIGMFGVLAGRLWQLQVRENERFSLLADSNRVNQRLVVPPRGRIFDRHGRLLAGNAPIYRVRLIPEQARDVRQTLQRLAGLVSLDDRRIEAILTQLRGQRGFVPVSIREDLSYDEVARIAVHAPDLPGVLLDAGLLRTYPEGDRLAHILGYTGPPTQEDVATDPDPLMRLPDFRIGKNGIERSYDPALRGRAGVHQFEVNAIGREIRELRRTDGDAGEDLRLTLDVELQRYCFERLAESRAASAVVLDVQTGAVRAMASVPSYDPAVFANGLSTETWRSLRDDPGHPLVNKCIRGQYPPGSTFKMITALAALEAGVIDEKSTIACHGHVNLGNARFHCWRPQGHGRLALVQGLAQSCDVYFYELARRVGVDRIAAMAQRFGLGLPVGVDLPGEQPGLVPTSEWKKRRFGVSWQRGETLVVGIGQGYMLATPLQLAVMTARLCNGGRAVRPAFAQPGPVNSPDGAAVEPPLVGVDEGHLALVLRGMSEVINGGRGTARSAALGLPGVLMAGKTGTAQVRRITKADRASGAHKRKDRPWVDRDHALFVAYAPVDAPRLAVSVIVEHGESGAKTAGPIARDIMRKGLELEAGSTRIAASGSRTALP